jgi:hypothetical protein
VSVTDLKVSFTLKHRNQAKTPSREMSFMWDLLLTIRAGRGRASTILAIP